MRARHKGWETFGGERRAKSIREKKQESRICPNKSGDFITFPNFNHVLF